jgi:hypothetical protein
MVSKLEKSFLHPRSSRGAHNLDQMPLSLACKLTLSPDVIWNPIQASAASQSENLDWDLRAKLFESSCPAAGCTSEW